MRSSDVPTPHEATRRHDYTTGFLAPYFVYDRDAAPDEPVPVVLAVSSEAAVSEVTRQTRPAFVSTLHPGLPRPIDPTRIVDPWRTVGLIDGRRLLIGRSSWPSEPPMTHGALWDALPPRVQGRLHLQWDAVRWDENPETEETALAPSPRGAYGPV